jgi:hypothetical protein
MMYEAFMILIILCGWPRVAWFGLDNPEWGGLVIFYFSIMGYMINNFFESG